MFALGIYDKLTPGNLTGGKFVAGTGTIDDDGKVGPIGGIEMKTVGARNKGAQYFLTPADNCAAAAKRRPRRAHPRQGEDHRRRARRPQGHPLRRHRRPAEVHHHG